MVPARGRIGIFNRSYYEDVLVVRVHPELLGEGGRKPKRSFWRHRFEAINALESHLVRERTVVLKFFLHLSKEEQRKRLLEWLNDPTKQWKFSPSDLAERSFWDDYTEAYEDALSHTSTKKAPWHVVPADHKWVARTAVAALTAHAIRSLELRYPEPTPEQIGAIAAARAQLEKDGQPLLPETTPTFPASPAKDSGTQRANHPARFHARRTARGLHLALAH